jgi:diadenosine tetraphosphate (Ap4A) HIT family hydrolase
MHPPCEYCQELTSPSESRFGRLYRGVAASRIVARTEHFVAMPTLGQLFRGSLLVLPVEHAETLAGLASERTAELHDLVRRLHGPLQRFGQPVFFEHGSTREVAGACGIYHAHLHLVPLPAGLPPRTLLPEATAAFGDLPSALGALRGSPHYLLAGDATGVVAAEVAALSFAPGSQYFRRRLAALHGLDRPWDWRLADAPEADLLSTLEAFGVGVAAESSCAAV